MSQASHNSFLIYFLDTNTVKAEHNFCFINTSHSRLKEKNETTSKSQTNCKSIKSLFKNPTTTFLILVSLSKIASNITTIDVESLGLISYLYQS